VLNVGGGNSALIEVNLSSLPFPLGSVNVQKATLTVFVDKTLVAGGLDISQVYDPWSETTVTYNSNLAVGAPFQSNVPVGATDSYVIFDITALMAQWVIGAAPNYGVEITAAVAQPNTLVVLDSQKKYGDQPRRVRGCDGRFGRAARAGRAARSARSNGTARATRSAGSPRPARSPGRTCGCVLDVASAP